MKLFLSYAHKDIEIVKELVVTLENAGHEVWFDTALKAGQSWQGQLGNEIAACDVFVYVMTPHSSWSISEWCHWEFVTAIEHHKPVLPLLMQKTDDYFRLPVVINHLQYADLTQGMDRDAIAKMLSDLESLRITRTNDLITKPIYPKGLPARASITQNVTASDNARVNVIGSQSIGNQTNVENQYVGEKARTWSLPIVLGLIAILIIAIFAIIAVLPQAQRDSLLFSAGLIPASETPTATATSTSLPSATPLPSNTPTATYTPSITPTATLIPFASDEVGIIIFEFDEVGDSIGTRSQIVDQLQDADVSVRLIPYTIDKDLPQLDQWRQAKAVSDQYSAVISMWGEGFTFGVEVYYDITPRQARFVETNDGAISVSADIENFSTYILNGMDSLYIVNFTLGQLHYYAEDYEKALAYLEDALNQIPQGREEDIGIHALYSFLGPTQYFLGQYEDAIESFSQAINADSSDALAYNNRGVANSDLGNYESAIADYDQAINLIPAYADFYRNRGAAKSELGEYESAIADYDQALALNSSDAYTFYNRGIEYANLGNFDAALTDFDRAISLYANFAEAYTNRGLVKSDLGDSVAAIKDHDRAIDLKPDYSEAYNNRGTDNLLLGNMNLAIEDFNRAIALNPAYADAYNNRANAKIDLNDYAGAIEDFTRSIDLNPQQAATYNNRGIAYSLLSDDYTNMQAMSMAESDFSKAIELGAYQAYLTRGILYFSIENYEQALSDFQSYENLVAALPDIALDMREQAEAGS